VQQQLQQQQQQATAAPTASAALCAQSNYYFQGRYGSTTSPATAAVNGTASRRSASLALLSQFANPHSELLAYQQQQQQLQQLQQCCSSI